MKFISKTLSVFILSSALLVNAQNECDELKNDLGDKVEIIECKNDDEGKISLLKINDFGMEEEDFKKVQSYKTISDFSYTLSNGKVNEKSGYPTSIDYLTNLKNLENLEKLYIGYNTYTMNCDPNYSSYPECYTYFSAPIGKNTFKDLKNLRELSLYRIDLHQDNINEISTLNNLKSLNTESSIFKKISDSKALNNLDNMNSFTYKASVVGESITILPMELLNNIKSLKKLNIQLYSNFHGAASFLHDELNLEFTEKSNIENLYLHGIRIKDNTVDEILKLNNIKELKFDTCIFDLNDEEYTKLENLGNRCPM
ncbi:hypothetical protein H8356DRAFT_966093 [Neocallimastix lanati (nom. inval.)]|uniref:RNI-like protein n=1 Tax=Neocallimastix californiae TaxID=1754190 RepID=A0A1Y2AU31_9FUNG|nr:hypothetical protein H8356DRAFT_966093 [Neocallimastix sp. JGI-2020a]ORY25986.1 hypothetical protein LY90DRAFT_513949 [Neocallimastix californiae]|eukprot:ORY25986.1 hypothetical protein LY90DRAFT_513949 [Neocallimastix californiae]